jgi:Uncharacterized protein conserved in bacteria
MKLASAPFVFTLILVLLTASGASAAITNRQNNLLGKFFVSSVEGEVMCVSDGRIFNLKKGDSIMARGTIIETKAKSNVTMVFSNGTGVYTDENTRFEIEKFDQEFFAPNNNLKVEPSNSSTLVALSTGRVVISTPRLLSGTTMVYKTAHAAVGIRGEKILIEADEKQTHVAMIAGNATVNVRNPDGTFVSIGKRLVTGQEAFVKYTIGGDKGALVLSDESTPDAESVANSDAPAATDVELASASEPRLVLTGNPITAETEATVIRLTGRARMTLPGSTAEVSVAEGAKLPAGSTLFTDEAGELHLQPIEGAVTTLRPNTTVQIEKLSVTRDGNVITKQTSLLALKAGTVVSTIDPAKSDINDYGIRTPKGIARAKGTSFIVSIEDDESFTITSTADTVSFLTSDGVTYDIEAGNVSITPAGGTPQPPISLATAVANNPGFADVIRTALNTVTNIVQNNLGSLPPNSASDLITKVARTASAALPAEATAIASQVVTAVTWPSSATSSIAPAAAAAVSGAITAAVPQQAAAIATSAALAAPAQAVAIAAAAAQAAPDQAAQIASAVTQTFVQTDSLGNVTPATVQTAAAVAAAVTTSAPNQAAPVAAAVMQALAQAAPLTPPLVNAQAASIIASSVTRAAPDQAVPVAATMMRTLTQTQTFAEASPQVVAQTAATLAAAVTVVVPPQAQEVATAVMQLLIQTNPNASPAATSQAAGLIAAAVSQVAPDQSAGIAQGVASAANLPLTAVQSGMAQAGPQVAQITQQVGQITQTANAASQQSTSATSALASSSTTGPSTGSATGGGSTNVAQSSTTSGGSGSSGASGNTSNTSSADGDNSSTSIIITQFDPNEVSDLTASLEAAQNAQAGVQFNPTPGSGSSPIGGGPGTVDPIPVVPSTPPVEQTASPANT